MIQTQDGVSEQRAAEAGEDDQCMRHVSVVTVGDLYLLMGREMEALTAVPAGNVCGTLTYQLVSLIYLKLCTLDSELGTLIM
jgi:translation elongation factor EF-G